jgi:glycosyltransferase involved in cell wall biosynthesis
MRKLLSRRPHPYYIIAPPYRRNSAGIRVLHMLCDALIRSGHEAYITTTGVAEHLMGPYLTSVTTAQHKAHGIEPIMILPETADGNPLNGNIVVRYLLNQPGFFGAGGNFGPDDIFFSYTKALLQPGQPEDQVLYMPAVDLNIFRLPDDPSKRVPGKVAFFRGKAGNGYIDPRLLPVDATEVTLQSPGSWEELADLFQRCEYFYSTEASGLGSEAILCGCVAVCLPNERAPLQISLHESKGYGVAWGHTPENIEHARATLPFFREGLLKHHEAFWSSLDHFIDVTQQAAQDFTARNRKFEALPWLAGRIPTASLHTLIDQHFVDVAVPSIGVVVLDANGDMKKLTKTLDSLVAHAPTHVSIRPLVLSNSKAPSGSSRFLSFDKDGFVATINSALNEFACDWFMIVQAGDEFTSSGLFTTGLELATLSGHRAVYADEILLHGDGRREFMLRPDLNLDLLLSYPSAVSRHWLFHRETWIVQGGFTSDCQQAFELDYILRLIESGGFEGVGHISEPLLVGAPVALTDNVQEPDVIERHLRARGFSHASVSSNLPGHYQVDYGQSHTPGVSILVLVDGRVAHAQRCLESLLENTTYGNYELLVLDRGNVEPGVCNWLSGIEQLGVAHIRVMRYPADLSVQAIQNMAANDALGEFILFLDSAVGVVGRDWLQQLLNHAMRPEVGSVGAKLVDAEGNLCQGGLVLGLGGPAGILYKGAKASEPGYMQRMQVDNDFSALSPQCLMVKRELFIAAGGFDEQMAPWAHVDLCLQLQQAGYLNVFTPRVQMLISEAEAAEATVEQEDRFYARWLPQLAREPAYNPNFSLNPKRVFKVLDAPLTWRPLAGWKPLSRVLAHIIDDASSAAHRIVQPFNALRDKGLIDGAITSDLLSVVELERFDADVVVLQRALGDSQLQAMRRMQAFSRAFKVYELDAYLPELPNSQRQHWSEDVLGALREGLRFMDRLVVSSDTMAQVFEGFHSDIRVIQSRLDPRWSALRSERRRSGKPRVGWVGNLAGADDVLMIADVIRELAGEVEWVFFGPCPDALRPLVHEVHSSVDMAAYPARLAALNLDLAVAPLTDSLFNRCRSNLALLEYGACGVPVVCSDIDAFRCALPVTLVKERASDWLEAIRAHLADPDGSAAMGDALQSAVRREWMLDDTHLQSWRDIWLPD